MLKVATVLPHEPYREYKDVERVYSGSTEIDKILDKNGNVLFAVNKEVEGTPALTYKGKEETNIKNYRIYGQTVDGESVGDRTGNLWDETNGVVTDNYIKNDGTTSIGVNGDRFICNRINVLPNNNYIFSWGKKVLGTNDIMPYIRVAQYDSNGNFLLRLLLETDRLPNNRALVTAENAASLWDIRIDDVSSTRGQHLEEIMLNSGSTALPYEPYGYKVPVTVEGKNLFDFDEWSKNINANSDNSLAKGIDGITITANSNDAFTTPYAYMHEGVYKIYVKPNTNYLLSWVSNNNLYGRVFVFKNGISDGTHALNTNNTTKYLLFGTDADTEFITLRFGVETAGNTITYSKIMLVEGSTPLPYEPYHAPTTTPIYLPEPIKMVGDEAEYIDYAEQKQHRVRKNLINSSIHEIRNTGVEYTVNNDKSITANGSTSSIFSLFLVKVYLTKGSYIISGCPQNGSRNTYRCELRDMELSALAQDTGAGVTYRIVTDGYYYYSIRIAQNYVCDNLTFYPMIRKADIEDDTYEPYINDTELDVTLPALPVLPGTNVLSVGTEVQPSNVYLKGRIKEIT